MSKTILITGATDGIGLKAAISLAELGHRLLVHGRNADKLEHLADLLSKTNSEVFTYQADFSDLQQVTDMTEAIKSQHPDIDVIINNAGVLKSADSGDSQIDIRFRVNTIAPFVLTKGLLENLAASARIINLASAAQAPFDLEFLAGKVYSDAMQAYAESKLALIAWTFAMAKLADNDLQFIALNPGSLLATKMVKEGFGMQGNDVSIGSDLLVEAALDNRFANANGLYFDNDAKLFSQPHPVAEDVEQQQALLQALDKVMGF